jgi:hypothetical protein
MCSGWDSNLWDSKVLGDRGHSSGVPRLCPLVPHLSFMVEIEHDGAQ